MARSKQKSNSSEAALGLKATIWQTAGTLRSLTPCSQMLSVSAEKTENPESR